MNGSVGVLPIPLYLIYAAQEPKYAATSAKADAQSTALIAYFQTASPGISSPNGLLKDYKALTVVLGAFGLQNAINNTAILSKLLTQDPSAPDSLAQKLRNAKYLAFAKALSNWTTPPFATPEARARVISAYTTNAFESKADKQAPGLANALYFTRLAPSITTLSQLQSDATLLAIAVTAAGLPLQNFQQLDFDQQTSILKNKINVADFQSPAFVKRSAEQYLIAQQQNAVDQGPPNGSLAGLFSDASDSSGDSVLSILDPSSGSSGNGAASSNVLSLFA